MTGCAELFQTLIDEFILQLRTRSHMLELLAEASRWPGFGVGAIAVEVRAFMFLENLTSLCVYLWHCLDHHRYCYGI